MSARDDLITDLKDWMTKGANDDFAAPIQGLTELANHIATFANKAEDTYGNKLTNFTASEFIASVTSLAAGSTPALSAAAFGTGIVMSFTGKQLATTNLPPGAVSGTSNSISTPPVSATVTQDFTDYFNTDTGLIASQAIVPMTSSDHLKNEMAKKMADILEGAVNSAMFTFNYMVPGVPSPLPMVTMGNISV